LTSKTRLSDSEQWTLTWDYRNRLTQDVEKTSAGVTVTNDVFTYDVLDRRIGKSANGTQTWMAYDGGNTFADFNNSGTLTMRYLYGNALDSLFARRNNNGNNAWYLTDMLGSVRQVAQTNGTILDALSYDSYGNILTETNSGNGDRFKFTAREWDNEIALQYNRARYYDPKMGRWISQDPKRFAAGDTNLYRTVYNYPLASTDPSGLQWNKLYTPVLPFFSLTNSKRCTPWSGWRFTGYKMVGIRKWTLFYVRYAVWTKVRTCTVTVTDYFAILPLRTYTFTYEEVREKDIDPYQFPREGLD
jgi:RHS repeat-associated protein